MGTYKGIAQGFHGSITATVMLENDRVTKVESEHASNAHIGDLGIQRLLKRIEAAESLDVDTVSGATFSTQAYLTAAKKAQAVAKGELSSEEALNLSVSLNDADSIVTDAVSSASITSHDEVNTSVAKKAIYLENDPAYFDEVYDVVIAGSGGAGLSAAVEASRAGLKTIVFEKAGIPGGTTNASGGVIQAAGTPYQKEFTQFKDDSPKKHAQLWIKAGEGRVDETLVWDLALAAPKNIEWLVELGLEFEAVYGHAKIPYVSEKLHADRIHQYKNGGNGGEGTILTLTLLKAFENNQGVIEYDSPVVALILDKTSHEVIGAVVEKNGQEVKVKAERGVVLATASIDHNPALAKELNEQQFYDISHSTLLSTPYDTGDGIMMGMGIGAAVAGMGGCIDFCSRTGNATNNQMPTIPMVIVNGVGKRFVREDATYAYQYRAIFQETKKHDAPTYMIFGEASIDEPGSAWTTESLATDVAAGLVLKADTLVELANLSNVPVANLQATLEQWNQGASQQFDSEFGRLEGLKAITGPYYAMVNKATNLGSLGGLRINTDSQVVNHFGQAIPGLYAAGLNAGGWVASYYPGSGMAIAGIIHQGRKAGQHLART